jgi:hypothetical protein
MLFNLNFFLPNTPISTNFGGIKRTALAQYS